MDDYSQAAWRRVPWPGLRRPQRVERVPQPPGPVLEAGYQVRKNRVGTARGARRLAREDRDLVLHGGEPPG